MFSLNVAAVACPAVLGGFEDNLQKLFVCLEGIHASKVDVVVLPLGALGGVPVGGLAHMASFVEAEAEALSKLAEATRQWQLVCALGVRIMHAGVLRNAVAVCAAGRIWGLVPQTTPGLWAELEEGIQTDLPSHHMTTWTAPAPGMRTKVAHGASTPNRSRGPASTLPLRGPTCAAAAANGCLRGKPPLSSVAIARRRRFSNPPSFEAGCRESPAALPTPRRPG